MQTFLQVLGGCTLLALVGLVVGALVIRHRFRQFKADVRGLKSTLRPGWMMLMPRTKPEDEDESRRQPEAGSPD